MGAQSPTLEVGEVEISLLPIVCCAPLVYAANQGLFEKHGLRVKLRTAPSWSGVKELLAYGKVEIAHVLTPMALAMSLGIDVKRADVRLLAIQNVNGSALVLAKKHAGVKDVRDMKGFRLGVPYPFSMHYYLLCDLLASHGLDPLSDVIIEEVAPPRFPYYLEKGWLDGAMSPEPFAQIAVQRGAAFFHVLSRDLWPGHPCCGLAISRRFCESRPRATMALLRGLIEAQRELHGADVERRRHITKQLIASDLWVPSSGEAVAQVLSGSFSDGLGNERVVVDRIDFVPQPFVEYGIWILAQMQRWGQLDGEVDHRAVAEAVFAAELTQDVAASAGFAERTPSQGLLAKLSLADPLASVRRMPFCKHRAAVAPRQRYGLPKAAAERISAILAQLAEVAGGRSDLALEVTADDEIGALERMLNEAIRNLRFIREAVDERLDLERQAARQHALITAQQEMIRELSTPIVPVHDGILALPLVGRVDGARALRVQEAVLAAVSAQQATTVIIDITGAGVLEAAAIDLVLKLSRAVSLLGAECFLVGMSPAVARAVAAAGDHLPLPPTLRDLRSGVEHALRQRGARAAARSARP